METRNYLTPPEILEAVSKTGVDKVNRDVLKQLILAFAAGAFVAFAGQGSSMASFNLLANAGTYGLGRLVTGLVFGAGLMLVILAGGELFTGNALNFISLLDKKITAAGMLRNWLLVYIGNFAGSVLIAFMMTQSGLLNAADGLFGGVAIRIAYGKSNMPFFAAFFSGIMCNWLVCLGVWAAYAAKDVAGKVLIIFFIICLFATSGFEHSVANMYYIPVAIMAKSNELWAEQSLLSKEALDSVNWGTFFIKNLLPVTLGNILGGSVLVGGLYRLAYGKKINK